MQMRRILLWPVMALLLTLSTVAFGFTPDPEANALEIPLASQTLMRQPAEHAPSRAAADLVAQRYGGTWRVSQWNQLSGTPESVYGSGIDVAAGRLDDDQVAINAARDFVAANVELLGATVDELVVRDVARGLGKVAVHFDQQFQGVPVHGARVRTLFTESGRLYAFGSSVYRDIAVNPVPSIAAAQAEMIAQGALPFDATRDALQGRPELLVLPVPQDEGDVVHHLVWRVRVETSEPFGVWVTHVDAHSGAILWRFNDVHFAYSGTVEGDIDNPYYCAVSEDLPFHNIYVTVSGQGTATTDENGAFSLPGSAGSQTVSTLFDGPIQNVNNMSGSDAQFSGPIQDNVPLAIYFDDLNSTRAERDVQYWVNGVDAFIKSIDNTYAHGKYTCQVNMSQTCNAWWNGNTMAFYSEGGGCANTGWIGDVMAHEYGHGLQSDLLGTQGAEGMGEGNGDISGSTMTSDSVIGRGFYLNNCTIGIRDCNNTLQYPQDLNGSIHHDGQLIAGFHWDSRMAMEAAWGAAQGRLYASELWHFGRKLWTPTGSQQQQVDAYFLADDDDGNISNGTPNFDLIRVGADNHNYAVPEVLDIILDHTPLPWTLDHANDYAAEAEVYSNISGAVVDQVSLFYRIDGGAYIEVAMTDMGGDIYAGAIPAQAADATVEYYLYARDSFGNEQTNPSGAPAENFLFKVFSDDFTDELEIASGWQVGAFDDDAGTGIWVREDPVGTFDPTTGDPVQPEDDHTPAPGTICFVTGNAPPGSSYGTNDVDGGKTTLYSPIIDLSLATQASVSYWRWYSNDQGNNPNADDWVVDVSNDAGATWTSVESGSPPSSEQNQWLQVTVDLGQLFGTLDLVRFRFVASDEGLGSIVEAAVDDILLDVQVGTTAVGPADSPDAAGRFALHDARPNPFNPSTTISYETPATGAVNVAIYDASGRLVRTLVNGLQESGAHRVSWDGRNDAGQRLASGVYHVRLTADGAGATQKMVLLK